MKITTTQFGTLNIAPESLYEPAVNDFEAAEYEGVDGEAAMKLAMQIERDNSDLVPFITTIIEMLPAIKKYAANDEQQPVDWRVLDDKQLRVFKGAIGDLEDTINESWTETAYELAQEAA